MIQSVTKKIEISAAHWLPKHDGKCKNLHGHNYVFEVTAKGEPTGENGFVIDFSLLKTVMNDVIGEWDHALLTHFPVETEMESIHFMFDGSTHYDLRDQKIVHLGVWTTAENLSKIAACSILEALPTSIVEITVVCWETSTSSASFRVTRPFLAIV